MDQVSERQLPHQRHETLQSRGTSFTAFYGMILLQASVITSMTHVEIILYLLCLKLARILFFIKLSTHLHTAGFFGSQQSPQLFNKFTLLYGMLRFITYWNLTVQPPSNTPPKYRYSSLIRSSCYTSTSQLTRK